MRARLAGRRRDLRQHQPNEIVRSIEMGIRIDLNHIVLALAVLTAVIPAIAVVILECSDLRYGYGGVFVAMSVAVVNILLCLIALGLAVYCRTKAKLSAAGLLGLSIWVSSWRWWWS